MNAYFVSADCIKEISEDTELPDIVNDTPKSKHLFVPLFDTC